MTFAEKIRDLRTKKGLSQTEFGNAVGVSLRTVRNWEVEGRYPKQHDIYAKIADVLGCDIDYLMTDEASFVTKSEESYGYRGRKGAEKLMAEVRGLFAGGELAEEDLDKFALAVQQAYIDAKQKNREKYAPKSRKKS